MGHKRGARADTNRDQAVSRRALLASVAGAAALAGCSGGGSNGDGGDDSSGDDGTDGSGNGGSGDDGPSIESMCNVSNNVDGLSIVGCQSEAQSETLRITVTVENDGDQDANLFSYRLQSRAYSSSETSTENNVTGSVTVTYQGTPEVPAGETAEVAFEITPESGVSVEDIQQYRIELDCGVGADGVYCEES